MCLRALEGRNYSPGLGRSQVYAQLIISQCAFPSALEGPGESGGWYQAESLELSCGLARPGGTSGLPQLSAGWADLVPNCLLSLSLSQIEGKLEMPSIGWLLLVPIQTHQPCGR